MCNRNYHSIVGHLYFKNKQTHIKGSQDLLGMVRWFVLPMEGMWVRSLACELRSHMLCGMTKNKTKQTNKNKPETRSVVVWEGRGRRKWNEGNQKVQNSSYKINKYSDVMYHMKNTTNTVVRYVRKLLTVQILSSHHKDKLFSIFRNLYQCELMNFHHSYCDNHFIMYASQITAGHLKHT